MRIRFFTTVTLALLGGFMLIETQSFPAGAVAWIGLGCGVLALALGIGMLGLGQTRTRPFGALAGLISLLGAWTVVESLVFSTGAALWLTFASGGAILALSVAGLVLHELSTERVVHSLEVGSGRRVESREPVAA
jgi:hypothetical protein